MSINTDMQAVGRLINSESAIQRLAASLGMTEMIMKTNNYLVCI